MTRALAHRGPDDEAYALVDRATGHTTVTRDPAGHAAVDLLLGVRRLAITDLGPAGAQPAGNEDGSIRVVLNGAIYDHAELRRDLAARGHLFRSTSDTEVIAHAYEEWGDACVERFNGMWAFLLWDGRRRRLLASRDRFGIKPLVMARSADLLAFASEPGALLAGGIVRAEADTAAVCQWLRSDVPVLGTRTPFRGIEQLPAATCLAIDAGGIRQWRYWDWPAPGDVQPVADPVEAFRDLLRDAVRLRATADVPAALLLSGGLDSSAIAALAGRGAALPAFCATFRDFPADESGYAAAAARHAGMPLTAVVAEPGDFDAALDDAVRALQSPLCSGQHFARYQLMRTVAGHGQKIVLEGQGADELLAGYTRRCVVPFARAAMQAGRPVAAARALLRHDRLGRLVRLRFRGRSEIGTLLAADIAIERPPKRAVAPGRDPLTALLIDDVERALLPHLLHFGDALSSAHGLESRLPFLDHRLVELITRLPFDWKSSGRESKLVLRRAMRGVMAPEVLDRPGKGSFPTPLPRWIAPGVLDRWRDELLGPTGRGRGIYDASGLERAFAAAPGSLQSAARLLRAASVERWYRLWIDTRPAAPA